MVLLLLRRNQPTTILGAGTDSSRIRFRITNVNGRERRLFREQLHGASPLFVPGDLCPIIFWRPRCPHWVFVHSNSCPKQVYASWNYSHFQLQLVR
jgi:hypothetical protein